MLTFFLKALSGILQEKMSPLSASGLTAREAGGGDCGDIDNWQQLPHERGVLGPPQVKQLLCVPLQLLQLLRQLLSSCYRILLSIFALHTLQSKAAF